MTASPAQQAPGLAAPAEAAVDAITLAARLRDEGTPSESADESALAAWVRLEEAEEAAR